MNSGKQFVTLSAGIIFLLLLFFIPGAWSQDVPKALKFEGGMEKYIINSDFVPQNPPFTVEFWAYPQALVAMGWGFDYNLFTMRNSFGIGFAANFVLVSGRYSPLDIQNNIWNHWAFVVDARWFVKIYRNGSQVMEREITSNLGINLFILGREFTGVIDEFRIWKSARTAQEIYDYKDRYTPKNHPDLFVYYNFEHFDGNFVVDDSGNHNHGTLVGMDALTSQVMGQKLKIGLTVNSEFGADGEVLPFRGSQNFNKGASISAKVPEVIYLDKSGAKVSTSEAASVRHTCTGYSVAGSVVSGTTNSYMFTLNEETNLTFHWKTDYALEIVNNLSGTDAGLTSTAAGNPDPVVKKHWVGRDELSTAFIDGVVNDITAFGTRYVVEGYDAVGAPFGQWGAYFNGTDVVKTDADAVKLADSSFTIEFWAKRNRTGSEYLIAQGIGSIREGLHIGFYDDNKFQFDFWADAIFSPNPVGTEWHHWACVFDKNNTLRSIYQDGNLVASNTQVNPYMGTGPVYIGKSWSDYINGFQGTIDEIRIWNIARSGEQIRANMNKTLNTSPGLVASWNFNQYSETTAVDSSGNSNHALNTGKNVYVAGAPGIPADSFVSFGSYQTRQQVPQFQMTGPVKIEYKWQTENKIQISTSVFQTGDLPKIQVRDSSGQTGGSGSGEFWYKTGTRLLLSSEPSGGFFQLKGYINGTGSIPKLMYTFGDDEKKELDITLTKGSSLTWDYGNRIFRETVTIGSPVLLNTVEAGIKERILTGKSPVNGSVVEAPAGSLSIDMYIWSDYEKKLYPLRPGKFMTEWETDIENQRVTTEITAVYPAASHYLHIAETPPVSLDPSANDITAFKEIRYTESDAVMDQQQGFTAKNRGRSVLLFTRKPESLSGIIPGLNPKEVFLSFDGTDDYVDCGNNIRLADSSFTVEFRAKRANTDREDFIFRMGSASETDKMLIFGFRANNSFTCAFYDDDLDTPAYTDTNWHHWAVVYDSTMKKQIIYRDGVHVAERTANGNFSGTNDIYIGKFRDSYFKGQLYEFRIWNQARTAEDIADHKDIRLSGAETGLVGYWRMDDLSGTDIADSVSGVNGILKNADPLSAWGDGDVSVPNPASGDLNQEKIFIRVVETRLWTDELSNLTAEIGAKLTSDYHDSEVPHNGYVFWEKSPYNPNTYTRGDLKGPIIPVNRQFTAAKDDDLVVVWYRGKDRINWPWKAVHYDTDWTSVNQIVIASRLGSEGKNAVGNDQTVFDPTRYQDLKIYNQPDPSEPGYNPNEEHALLSGSFRYMADPNRPTAAFALRNDLNIRTQDETYTSDPYVLVEYLDTRDNEKKMQVYEVVSYDESRGYTFNYSMNAGEPVVAPYPLNQVIGATTPPQISGRNGDPNQVCYWEDHKGQPYSVSGAGEKIAVSGAVWDNADSYTLTLASDKFIAGGNYRIEVSTATGMVGGMKFQVGTKGPGDLSAVYTDGSAIAGGSGSFIVRLNPAVQGLEAGNFTLYRYTSDAHIVSDFWYPLSPSFWCSSANPGCSGAAADGSGKGNVGAAVPWFGQTPVQVRYDAVWPHDPPVLKAGESLTFAGGEYRSDHQTAPGLPGVLGWAAGQIVFDSSNPNMESRKLGSDYMARLVPVLNERTVPFPADQYPNDYRPGSNRVDTVGTRYHFKSLHAGLKNRIFYDYLTGKLGIRGFVNGKTSGDKTLTAAPPSLYVLQPNILSDAEKEAFFALEVLNYPLKNAMTQLFDLSRDPNDVYSDYGAYGAGLSPAFGFTETSMTVLRNKLGTVYKVTGDTVSKIQSENKTKDFVRLTQGSVDSIIYQLSQKFRNSECLTNCAENLKKMKNIYFESQAKLEGALPLPGDTGCASESGNSIYLFYMDCDKEVKEMLKGAVVKGIPPSWSNALTAFRDQKKEFESFEKLLTALIKQSGEPEPGPFFREFIAGYIVVNDDRFILTGIENLKGRRYASEAELNSEVENAVTPLWYRQKSLSEQYFQTDPPRELSWYKTEVLSSVTSVGVIPEIALGPGNALVPNDGLLAPGFPVSEGYVTLAENNHESLGALPVTLHVIKVVKDKYRGAINPILSDNVFDEKITLRHTADFGGNPGNLIFEWWYREEDGNNLSTPENAVGSWSFFPDSSGKNGLGMSEICLAGSGKALLVDNLFYTRYRHKSCDPNTNPACWSDWAGAANSRPGDYRAQLAEGWVKRVLNAVNPYEARIRDFTQSDSPATYISMIQQAGRRYEGPVALNPAKDVIENVGLIELYETVMKRAKDLSIGLTQPETSSGVVTALLLAATRISDFYTLLGNESYNDALDPTIGFSTASEYGSLAPTIFSFMNQMPGLLDEELALLRGTDQYGAVPVYNRLIWNFTKAQGEVAYAMNYSIRDMNLDGFIDENDGQILYPQGHGDAWGHYLTALKTYYALLGHPYFNWESRSEKFIINGVVVDVDYLDERKFAEAAAAKAKVGKEIADLTYRSEYVEDPDGQWQGYKDTDKDRAWGVTGWGRRAAQGAFFDWTTANAILPAEDTNPEHTGLKKIDRTTVNDLNEIAEQARNIQLQYQSASKGLNPLGLAGNSVPFDIDPARLEPGSMFSVTHFEQVYEKAVKSVNNARIIFDHAADMRNRIRQVADSSEQFTEQTDEKDRDFRNRLIEIFGTPYEGTIGPGKLYPAGYKGPDYFLYAYIDVNEVSDKTLPPPSSKFTGFFKPMDRGFPKKGLDLWGNKFEAIGSLTEVIPGLPPKVLTDVRSAWSQFFAQDLGPESFIGTDYSGTLEVEFPMGADEYGFQAPAEWGMRTSPGEIQLAMIELVKAEADVKLAVNNYDVLLANIQNKLDVLVARQDLKKSEVMINYGKLGVTTSIQVAVLALKAAKGLNELTYWGAEKTANSLIESIPKALGTAPDALAPVRGQLGIALMVSTAPFKGISWVTEQIINQQSNVLGVIESMAAGEIKVAEYRYEIQLQLKEIEVLMNNEAGLRIEIFKRNEEMRQLSEKYRSVLARGLRLMEERKAFNAKVAAKTQGERYKDMAFRINLNDALSKYRSAFDTAARYTYLAAKAYDYETNLDEKDPSSAQPLLSDIVRQRTLGQFLDGQPVVGRGGIADTLARLQANYDVLKGQMGFNNPQTETGRFSLRQELFRIRNGNTPEEKAVQDKKWRDMLESLRADDLSTLPEFHKYCRPFAAEDTGAQPGIVLTFSTRINSGSNFFGFPLAGGDHAYDSTNFATKVRSVGLWFENYDNANLAETPRAYLIPAGMDVMLVPNSNDLKIREWTIVDQKLPVPLPVGNANLNDPDWIPALDSMDGSMIQIRRFSSFRAYHDSGYFDQNQMSYDSRLVGRSVWNTRWMLIIPGATFLADPKTGLDTFIHGNPLPGTTDGSRDGNGVKDIKLFFQTYAISGN